MFHIANKQLSKSPLNYRQGNNAQGITPLR
jgi:hypothetical protein